MTVSENRDAGFGENFPLNLQKNSKVTKFVNSTLSIQNRHLTTTHGIKQMSKSP